MPGGQVPLSGSGSHMGGAPPQQGWMQSCPGLQVSVPQMTGPPELLLEPDPLDELELADVPEPPCPGPLSPVSPQPPGIKAKSEPTIVEAARYPMRA